MTDIQIRYEIPDNAPDWLFQCIADGDWNGILEYVCGRRPSNIEVV
ncbi:hypothetical protein SEA_SLIMJIMMY_86 [Mycobacterium phage SlimJimmy]|nr:hypothetical protein [Mycobacterium phage SirSheldon]WMI33265.1 hypothetical protein SEA_SLIMJIMMY_86 [Mycobacterium phage SlimJimmy]WNN95666.1 hypothetical protein SEA_GLASKE16_88 [Mycobacterium phage Glaske16]